MNSLSVIMVGGKRDRTLVSLLGFRSMLRYFPVLVRAAFRVPVAATLAIVVIAAAVGACGIKGPLKPAPPPAPAAATATPDAAPPAPPASSTPSAIPDRPAPEKKP
jgi:predicted small lipoprotein YifL